MPPNDNLITMTKEVKGKTREIRVHPRALEHYQEKGYSKVDENSTESSAPAEAPQGDSTPPEGGTTEASSDPTTTPPVSTGRSRRGDN